MPLATMTVPIVFATGGDAVGRSDGCRPNRSGSRPTLSGADCGATRPPSTSLDTGKKLTATIVVPDRVRADELESGALVDAAGRRWENDQKLQPPSPAPLYVAVAERGLGDWRISSRTARQSRLRRIVGVLLQAAVTDSGMEHARKRAGSACRSIWSLWSRCGCLCDCLGPLRLERTLV